MIKDAVECVEAMYRAFRRRDALENVTESIQEDRSDERG